VLGDWLISHHYGQDVNRGWGQGQGNWRRWQSSRRARTRPMTLIYNDIWSIFVFWNCHQLTRLLTRAFSPIIVLKSLYLDRSIVLQIAGRY
jgi:hypothetical protein